MRSQFQLWLDQYQSATLFRPAATELFQSERGAGDFAVFNAGDGPGISPGGAARHDRRATTPVPRARHSPPPPGIPAA